VAATVVSLSLACHQARSAGSAGRPTPGQPFTGGSGGSAGVSGLDAAAGAGPGGAGGIGGAVTGDAAVIGEGGVVIALDSGADHPVADTALPGDATVQMADPSATVGTCPVAEPSSPPVCPGTCGNGRRDTCQPWQEPCDGADLGVATCASLGYAGGTLRCLPACGFDVSGCQACEPGPAVAACTSHATAPPDTIAGLTLAANEGQLALAFISRGSGVHFLRLRADLSLDSETTCLGPARPESVSLAPTPGGWLLAVGTTSPPAVHLISLGQDGRLRAPMRTMSLTVGGRLLAARPDGGPLLALGRVVDAAVPVSESVMLDPLGNEVTPRLPLEPRLAVSTGDGILVAVNGNGAVLTKLGLDGTEGARRNLGPTASITALTWTGSEARATFITQGLPEAGGYWIRLRGDGAPLGTPVALRLTRDQLNTPLSLVARGDDSFLLTTQYGTGGPWLELRRLDLDGVSGPAVRLSHLPSMYSRGQLVRRGDDLLAAWDEQNGLSRYVIARVTP
jgi:hypothetical protein